MMYYSKIILFITTALLSFSIFADVSVEGYTRQDGTYVQPHHRRYR